jgi:hypothetical protein
MSDKHELSDRRLRHICWGMCTFCVLVLVLCLSCVVSRYQYPVDNFSGTMALGGVMALIGFWVFFSIAHEEQSQ